MSQKSSYVSNIKKKYGIKTQQRTKFITLEDYEYGQKKIRTEIDDLFRDALPSDENKKMYKKAYDIFVQKNGDYRILELWEEPTPGMYIKGLVKDSKRNVKFVQGFVCASSPTEFWVKSMKESTKCKRIGRHGLILTKYSDSQMKALNLNRIMVQGRTYKNKDQNLVVNLNLV